MPPRPIPPRDQDLELRFPAKGIDQSQGYNFQVPGTTPAGANVRAFEPGTQRSRGGVRPGLSKYVGSRVPGGSNPFQCLEPLVGVGYAAPAPAGGSYLVQTTAGVSGTGTALACAFPGGVTNGNAILVLVGSTNGGGAFPASVTDGGNTYTRIDNSSVSNTATSVWLATAVTGAPAAATVNWAAGGSSYFAYAVEVANLTASPVDAGSEPTGIGTTGLGINFTTTHTPGIAFCCNVANQSITQTGGSWVALLSGQFFVAYRPLPAAATVGADLTWSFASSTAWAACMKGLKSNA